jgi:hypothetical protein
VKENISSSMTANRKCGVSLAAWRGSMKLSISMALEETHQWRNINQRSDEEISKASKENIERQLSENRSLAAEAAQRRRKHAQTRKQHESVKAHALKLINLSSVAKQ